jgi:glyoxylase-like metal-dependent hydrolase (beta-lactamase superfamily II)
MRLTVVDPASPDVQEQQRLLEHLRALPGQVERILLTHHHWDHIGGAQALADELGVPVAAHPRTAELLRDDVRIDEFVDEGDAVETDLGSWSALHTPGHASGHLCLLHQDRKTLVAGDMVAGVGTIVLDPPEGDLEAYLASLARLRALHTDVLLPAHGPALTDPQAVLDYYISHRNDRTEQVLASLRSLGSGTPLDCARLIYTELPEAFLWLAARQVLCHLQYLAAREAVRTSYDDTWRLA